MKKLGIIFMTDEYVDHNKHQNKQNIRNRIQDILEDSDNFQLKSFDGMTDDLCATIKKHISIQSDNLVSNNMCISVCNIYETMDIIYTGYYVSYSQYIDHNMSIEEQKEHARKIKFNSFGSQIASDDVASNMIILKQNLVYDIIDNNIKTATTNDTITNREILDVFESVFVKTGITIDTDGTIEQYSYVGNPIEYLMFSDPDFDKHYVYHEYEVYTHVMIVFVNSDHIEANINEKASLLCGCDNIVKGKAYVALYRKPVYGENPPYVDLNLDRFNKIFGIRTISPELTTGMATNPEKEYVNLDKLLQLEHTKHSSTQKACV